MIILIIIALAVLAFIAWLVGLVFMHDPFLPASGMATFSGNAGLGAILVVIFIALIIVGGIIVAGFVMRALAGKNNKFEKFTGKSMQRIFKK